MVAGIDLKGAGEGEGRCCGGLGDQVAGPQDGAGGGRKTKRRKAAGEKGAKRSRRGDGEEDKGFFTPGNIVRIVVFTGVIVAALIIVPRWMRQSAAINSANEAADLISAGKDLDRAEDLLTVAREKGHDLPDLLEMSREHLVKLHRRKLDKANQGKPDWAAIGEAHRAITELDEALALREKSWTNGARAFKLAKRNADARALAKAGLKVKGANHKALKMILDPPGK